MPNISLLDLMLILNILVEKYNADKEKTAEINKEFILANINNKRKKINWISIRKRIGTNITDQELGAVIQKVYSARI